jgi:prophage regulatory protein
MQEGTFPKPISLGSRAVGWLEHEIDDWLDRRIRASRPSASHSVSRD